MRAVGILIGVILLVLICSAPAHAQIWGGSFSPNSLSGPTFRSMPFNPPTEFHGITVSGSDSTFLPSSFMPYDQAVALGSADPARAVFMNFDDAVKKGLANQTAQEEKEEKSPAEAARANRLWRERQRAAEAKSKVG